MYCDCYEDELKKLGPKKSVAVWYCGARIDSFTKPKRPDAPKWVDLEKKLQDFGIEDYAIELVLTRVVDGWTLEDIVKEQGWSTESMARYHLKKTLERLRRGNFKV